MKSRTFLFVTALIVSLALSTQANPPDWWTEQQALSEDPGNPGNPPAADDYAVLNQGQLKNLALAAYRAFEEQLPGGAGLELKTHIEKFYSVFLESPKSSPQSDDFAAVNQGQLKAVAKPFYDRLATAGYIFQDSGTSLWVYPWLSGIPRENAEKYPWDRTGGIADHFAVANIGQAKHLFSFRPGGDSDVDDLPDWWEEDVFTNLTQTGDGDADSDGLSNYHEFLNGSDPLDFYNGQAPKISIASGNQQGDLPDEFLDEPLIVKVRNNFGTLAPLNTLVDFEVTEGGALLADSPTGNLSSTLQDGTDAEGLAQALLRLPSAGTSIKVRASVTSPENLTAHVDFTATIGDPSATPTAPSGLLVTRSDSNTIIVRWRDAANETSYRVERKVNSGSWAFLANVSANVTTYPDINAPEYDEATPPKKILYLYRVIARNDNADDEDGPPSIPVDPDPYDDFDGDYLPNHVEVLLGTDPALEDTDDDGYNDGDEGAPLMEDFAPKRMSAPRYFTVPLGTQLPNTEPLFINNLGQVLYKQTLSGEPTKYYFQKPGVSPVEIAIPGTITPTSMNNSGVIVGRVTNPSLDDAPWLEDSEGAGGTLCFAWQLDSNGTPFHRILKPDILPEDISSNLESISSISYGTEFPAGTENWVDYDPYEAFPYKKVHIDDNGQVYAYYSLYYVNHETGVIGRDWEEVLRSATNHWADPFTVAKGILVGNERIGKLVSDGGLYTRLPPEGVSIAPVKLSTHGILITSDYGSQPDRNENCKWATSNAPTSILELPPGVPSFPSSISYKGHLFYGGGFVRNLNSGIEDSTPSSVIPDWSGGFEEFVPGDNVTHQPQLDNLNDRMQMLGFGPMEECDTFFFDGIVSSINQEYMESGGFWSSPHFIDFNDNATGVGTAFYQSRDASGNPDGPPKKLPVLFIPYEFVEIQPNNSARHLPDIPFTSSAPVVTVTSFTADNLVHDPVEETIMVDLGFSAVVESELCDLSPDGEIDHISVIVNGDPDSIGSPVLGVSKTPDPNNRHRPHPYLGTTTGFEAQGVELTEGINVITFEATDPAYGMTGSTTYSIEVTGTQTGGDEENPIFSYSVAPPELVDQGRAGQYRPIGIRVGGNEEFLAELKINLNDGQGEKGLIMYQADGRYYLDTEPSAAVIMSYRPPSEESPPPVDEEAMIARWEQFSNGLSERGLFLSGFAHGFLAGGVDVVGSIGSAVWSVGKYLVLEGNPIAVTIRLGTGSEFPQTMAFLDATNSTVRSLGAIAYHLAQGAEESSMDLMYALMTGDIAALDAIGAKLDANTKNLMQLSGDVLKDMFKHFAETYPDRQGYFCGRVTFEIAAIFMSWTKITKASTMSKAKFLDDLKGNKFVMEFAPNLIPTLKAMALGVKTSKMCFVAGTPIHTPQGVIPIEKIRPGDLVWSRDPNTHEIAAKPVVETFVTHPVTLFHVRYATLSRHSSGSNSSDVDTELVCTGEHPFYVQHRGDFVEADELKPGDRLLLLDGSPAEVTGILANRATGPPFTTYNFEVQDFHTYHAGNPGLWVHNTSTAPCDIVFAAFFRVGRGLKLTGNALKVKRFDILVETKRLTKGIPDKIWGRSSADVGQKMLDDYSAGVFTSVDELPSYTHWKNFFNGITQGGVDIHHSVEGYIQELLGMPLSIRNSCPGVPLPRNKKILDSMNQGLPPDKHLVAIHKGMSDGGISGILQSRIPTSTSMSPQQIIDELKAIYLDPNTPQLNNLWPVSRDWLRAMQQQGHLDQTLIIN